MAHIVDGAGAVLRAETAIENGQMLGLEVGRAFNLETAVNLFV
jgi:hypothetical protein